MQSAILRSGEYSLTLEYEDFGDDWEDNVRIGFSSPGCLAKSAWDCCKSQSVSQFVAALTSLYETLKVGEAVLPRRFDDSDLLRISSDGKGGFSVEGKIKDNKIYSLSFCFFTDQSYLKEFITQLGKFKYYY